MKYIKLRNGQVAYTHRGQGKPVLLVHGLGSSSRDWEMQINDLSRVASVWALDLRGHGESARLTRPLRLGELADDVAEFISVMDIQGCTVIGISMGGMVGFDLLSRYPQLINGLAVINSAPSFPIDSWHVRAKLMMRLAMLRVLGMRNLSRLLARNLFPKPQQAPLRSRLVQAFGDNDRRSYLHAIGAIAGWSSVPAVNQVDLPVLVVTGDRDYTPIALKQQYTEQLLNGRLEVIYDSGHATPLDQPEQLNFLLRRFLSELSGSDSCPVAEPYVP
ncbi:alpha/beta fold hydrolase [Halopseudomonas maritima]|uniref:alpha/beta fold hydrolase n=1 Tax=Halopseudomonas maritima TaxID=2918528 RepID=UPI001EEB0ACA|nr:alpha/beta hydrolase [Halopseudomonas maritima]UJJ32321.1 alpha/beta hydrolase [Halopseudomonas maritima]